MTARRRDAVPQAGDGADRPTRYNRSAALRAPRKERSAIRLLQEAKPVARTVPRPLAAACRSMLTACHVRGQLQMLSPECAARAAAGDLVAAIACGHLGGLDTTPGVSSDADPGRPTPPEGRLPILSPSTAGSVRRVSGERCCCARASRRCAVDPAVMARAGMESVDRGSGAPLRCPGKHAAKPGQRAAAQDQSSSGSLLHSTTRGTASCPGRGSPQIFQLPALGEAPPTKPPQAFRLGWPGAGPPALRFFAPQGARTLVAHFWWYLQPSRRGGGRC